MSAQDPAVFIGSSSEGKPYAEYLQAALEDYCEAAVWDQGTFGLSESGLDALIAETQRADFAILVLTPDDVTVKRDQEEPSARDNVIFEAGLFAGALGPKRTFLVHARDLQLNLPSDLAGITTCTFRSQRKDENLRAAVNTAALRIRERMRELGIRKPGDATPAVEMLQAATSSRTLGEEKAELDRELDVLSVAAEAQGWSVKTRTESVYRLLSPDGTRYSFAMGAARETRMALRDFARELSEQGLRFNRTLSLRVDAVPPPAERRAKERVTRSKKSPRPRRRSSRPPH